MSHVSCRVLKFVCYAAAGGTEDTSAFPGILAAGKSWSW